MKAITPGQPIEIVYLSFELDISELFRMFLDSEIKDVAKELISKEILSLTLSFGFPLTELTLKKNSILT